MSRVDTLCGIHEDVSIDAYHADSLTPEPAISSSGIRTLLSSTPAHFKARNPRLTDFPDLVETYTPQQDLGTLIHRLVLGKGQEIAVIDGFDDWRKKEAQQRRDDARESGLLPVLEKTFMQAQGIADRLTPRLAKRFGTWPIGFSEAAMIWQKDTPHGRIFCRALVDHMSHGAHIIDLKNTERSLNDDELARKIASDGSDIQAAFYLEGLYTLYPEIAGKGDFTFVFQEVEVPFETRFVTLTESWLVRARIRIEKATTIFAQCLRVNEWPGWPMDAQLSAPSWLESKWVNEELEEAV